MYIYITYKYDIWYKYDDINMIYKYDKYDIDYLIIY